MTPQEALNNLNQVARNLSATAEVHEALRESVRVIAEALEKPVSDATVPEAKPE